MYGEITSFNFPELNSSQLYQYPIFALIENVLIRITTSRYISIVKSVRYAFLNRIQCLRNYYKGNTSSCNTITSHHCVTYPNRFFYHSRLLVGAPAAESGQPGIHKGGAVYKCAPDAPGRCDLIPFDTKGKHIGRNCHFPELSIRNRK